MQENFWKPEKVDVVNGQIALHLSAEHLNMIQDMFLIGQIMSGLKFIQTG